MYSKDEQGIRNFVATRTQELMIKKRQGSSLFIDTLLHKASLLGVIDTILSLHTALSPKTIMQIRNVLYLSKNY